MSNVKEVSRHCSPEVEYLMISCRPHYLPREFSSILFIAIYLPPQTDLGTNTALNQLYKAISKQKKCSPRSSAPSGPGTLMQANLNFTKFLPACHMCSQRKKNSRPPLLHTQRCIQSSPALHLENLTIILSS